MADPISELIAQNLLATLNGIKMDQGFENDVYADRPRPGLGNRRRDRLCVLVQGSPTKVQEEEEDFFHVYWLMPFSIVCHVVESEQSDMPLDRRLNSLIADIQKALLLDIHRGNLAHDTDLGDPVFEELPESLAASQAAAIVPCFILYRTARADPYTQTATGGA